MVTSASATHLTLGIIVISVSRNFFFFFFFFGLTLGRTRKIIPQWGWMEPLPGVFDMLQYFETILPSVESL